ncbi:MAG: helix-turn-helix domain-containing protein [Candidatus Omnitrophica bacterium]|nr:helix-turn-helix domain-containing protein [Candidatus Omnitrophota bacterium]
MSVGEQLRQAREARKLSMADVTAAIKIQPWVLQALEADRLQEQMSTIYAKGFLASYARFLHLAPEPLLGQIVWPGTQPAAQEAQAPPAAPQQPAEIPSVVTWTMPTIQLPKVQLPSIRLPKIQLPKVQLPRVQLPEVQIPWVALQRFGKVAAAAAVVIGVVLVNPLRWLPKIQQPARKPPQQTAAKPTAKKAAKAAPAAAQPPVKLASLAPVSPSAPRPVAPAPAPTAKVEPLELSIVATRATWIRVQADGKLLTQQRLERGAKERWVGKKSLEVVIAKPSQVEVLLNGQPITTAAIQHKGRFTITHQGINRLPEETR